MSQYFRRNWFSFNENMYIYMYPGNIICRIFSIPNTHISLTKLENFIKVKYIWSYITEEYGYYLFVLKLSEKRTSFLSFTVIHNSGIIDVSIFLLSVKLIPNWLKNVLKACFETPLIYTVLHVISAINFLLFVRTKITYFSLFVSF